ncbi:sensor histidine kinase [Tateyamaria sp. SN6-1]|uniref:sensor histidine kinase n=1 Tax=Tateyamaria sp. SN6-1 TaxID=3092148 RepID=UPI0039F61FB2
MTRASVTAEVEGADAARPDPGIATDPRVARAAFSALPIAAFVLDHAGTIVLHTRRASRMYSSPIEAGHDGLNGMAFALLTDLDERAVSTAFRESVASGGISLPMRDARRIGVTRTIDFHLSLMRIEGVQEQLYLLSQDHMRASAEALQTANVIRQRETERSGHLETHITELQRTVLSMETFAHAASHDLKTPIGAIAGLLELFQNRFGDDLPDEAAPFLGHMQDAIDKMETLTTSLLAHAKSSAAPLDLNRVSVHEMIDQCITMLETELRDAVTEVQVEGPDVHLMAEASMLQILLINILSNAIKNKNADRALNVTIATRRTGDGAHLTISDTGGGFDPNQARAIFLPFLRLKAEVKGTGIGLATCAEICRRHGWDISARSDGQSGASFTIVFPVVVT